MALETTFNTGSSNVVNQCQSCNNPDLSSILFLGYMPPVNDFRPLGERPKEQMSYPAELLYCSQCNLVQLGLVVDSKVLFPHEYPYTSSTTKVLRENFVELYQECTTLVSLSHDELVIDIGSNDGNLLSNFKDNHRVLGITPEKVGEIAIQRGIPTLKDYFTTESVQKVHKEYGLAKLITATNVFAHIEDINTVTKNIVGLLKDKGVFISESHYLYRLIETLQYDTIYHEHQRYYSIHSLEHLLNTNGLEIFHAKEIPSHGGSIRVYAARHGDYPIQSSVNQLLTMEKNVVTEPASFTAFAQRVSQSKLDFLALLHDIKKTGARIYGIGAPSRGTTLASYTGIDEHIVEAVMEVSGSHKIGKYIPGTLIPVREETKLFTDQPEYALLFSWHITDEIAPKLKQKGFKGKYIIPLPNPRILKS